MKKTSRVTTVTIASIPISIPISPRISRECLRLNQKMRMTADHPKPIRRRFDPVTFAATRDVSVVTAPVAVSNVEPAYHARTASMAYSGRTAIRASTAIASDADTSNFATSAAQESRNAPATMPKPKTAAASIGSTSTPEKRTIAPGTPSNRSTTMVVHSRGLLSRCPDSASNVRRPVLEPALESVQNHSVHPEQPYAPFALSSVMPRTRGRAGVSVTAAKMEQI